MGNCMERSIDSHEVERKQEQQEEEEKGAGFVKESGFETGGMRIKIVLTKEELAWLLLQLKDESGKKLEEVLGEMERARSGKVVGWKPSLESIMESPEVLDQMDRS